MNQAMRCPSNSAPASAYDPAPSNEHRLEFQYSMVMALNLIFALAGLVVGTGLGYWAGRRRSRAQAAVPDLSLDLELN